MKSLRTIFVPRIKNILNAALYQSSPRYYCTFVIVTNKMNQRMLIRRHDPLFARRPKSTDVESDEDIEKLFSEEKPGWVSVQWGEKERTQAVEMNDRIRKAVQFDSRKLSKEESERLKVALGLDAEELALLAKEEDAAFDEKLLKDGSLVERSGERKRVTKTAKPEKVKEEEKKKEKKMPKREAVLRAAEQVVEDEFAAVRIKGFLELNPYICSGCGTPFQSKNEDNPGFLPKEKFVEHQNRAKYIRDKQEAVKILNMAGIDMGSDTAREILQAAKVSTSVIEGVKKLGDKAMQRNMMPMGKKVPAVDTSVLNTIDEKGQLVNSIVGRSVTQEQPASITDSSEGEEDPVELPTLRDLRQMHKQQEEEDMVCICQRCFRLQQYGQVEEALRPGWSKHELLTPERFETILGAIRSTDAVVLCLIDLFDLQGSVLPNLKQIAGPNPIVIAANKIDLLPGDASSVRLTGWIHSEVKEICGLKSPRDRDSAVDKSRSKEEEHGVLRIGNVHLVSCQSGFGMNKLMASVMAMAKDNGNKVYVMGAANVGKSSFINRLLDTNYDGKERSSIGGRKKKKSPRSTVPQATVSNLPGTTLDFLKIKLPNGVTMIDTPGLLNKGQLTSKLTTEELKKVIPVKPINAVTLRMEEGRCVLLGGLATVELAKGRPFYFTFFVSNEVKLHVTNNTKVADFLERHLGSLITPPDSYERLQQLGTFVPYEFDLPGDGWRKSSKDIVIAGLGWISITGVGEVKVRVTVPEGTAVGVRDALLPYESTHTAARFTGGRIQKLAVKRAVKNTGWKSGS